MQNQGENCETCRPDGLKLSTVNGVTRVEVPQDFGFEDQGGIGPIVERAMAYAEQLKAFPSAPVAPSAHPLTPVRFPHEGGQVVGPNNNAPTSHAIRVNAQQFSTAVSSAAASLGSGPPKMSPSNQFSTAQSAAADVLGHISSETSGRATVGGPFFAEHDSPWSNEVPAHLRWNTHSSSDAVAEELSSRFPRATNLGDHPSNLPPVLGDCGDTFVLMKSVKLHIVYIWDEALVAFGDTEPTEREVGLAGLETITRVYGQPRKTWKNLRKTVADSIESDPPALPHSYESVITRTAQVNPGVECVHVCEPKVEVVGWTLNYIDVQEEPPKFGPPNARGVFARKVQIGGVWYIQTGLELNLTLAFWVGLHVTCVLKEREEQF